MVQNLLERTVNALTEKGYAPDRVNHMLGKDYGEMRKRQIEVYETDRCNRRWDEGNVTVTIEVFELHLSQDTSWRPHTLKSLGKFKVPKNASDKVLMNRVEKAIETFNK